MSKYICFNCKKTFNPSRSDQIFCSNKCRRKYSYIPVPQCGECSQTDCRLRDTSKKYSPAKCFCRLQKENGRHDNA